MDSQKVRNASAPTSATERRNILLQQANAPSELMHRGLPMGQRDPDMFGKIGKPKKQASNDSPRNTDRRLG